MVMTRFGTTYGGHTLPTESDKALGLIDIALHPHLDHAQFPENSQASLEKLAATISVPSYLIDDQTAIRMTDGIIEVVSEGKWKLFTPRHRWVPRLDRYHQPGNWHGPDRM